MTKVDVKTETLHVVKTETLPVTVTSTSVSVDPTTLTKTDTIKETRTDVVTKTDIKIIPTTYTSIWVKTDIIDKAGVFFLYNPRVGLTDTFRPTPSNALSPRPLLTRKR